MTSIKNRQLKSIIKSFGESYARACDDSWKEHVSKLSPGQMAPAKGKIYGEERRKKFEKECESYRAQAYAIISTELNSCNKKLSEAPSADAVNTIKLLSLRSKESITPEEVNRLIDTYGSNVQAFKAITSVAREKGIRTGRINPVEEKIETFNGLNRSLNTTLSLKGAESGHASSGFLAMLGASVDEAFPEI